PAAVTLTEYVNHSPALVFITSKPPPASAVASRSTSVERYTPPEFPVVVSKYAIDCPPSSKFSASNRPGIEAGVPPYAGDPPGGGLLTMTVMAAAGAGLLAAARATDGAGWAPLGAA